MQITALQPRLAVQERAGAPVSKTVANHFGQTIARADACDRFTPSVQFSGKKENKNLLEASVNGSIADVDTWLTKGADINYADKKGLTALHIAANKGHTPLVNHLLAKRANFFLTDKEGYTPLHHASSEGRTESAEALLNGNAFVNSPNKYGTPLHLAVMTNHNETAEMLLARGADVNNQENKERFTPLHIAAMRGNAQLTNALLEKDAKTNLTSKDGSVPLHGAALEGHSDVLEALVKHDNGATINHTTNDGFTPLHQAIGQHKVGATRTLLKAGADVNIADKAKKRTALHWAAKQRDKEIVELLLAHGKSDLFAPNAKGVLPVHEAQKAAIDSLIRKAMDERLGLQS